MKIKIHEGMNRDDLARLFDKRGYKVGLEVGTHRGRYSEVLCGENKNLKLYTVDAFDIVYGDRYSNSRGRSKQRRVYEAALQNLESFNCEVIKGLSLDVAKKFPVESLDFVYIDGSHAFDYVMSDIIVWGQRVRKGGIISGHDYFEESFPDVVSAVNCYTEVHGVEVVNTTTDHTPSWWFERTW